MLIYDHGLSIAENAKKWIN